MRLSILFFKSAGFIGNFSCFIKTKTWFFNQIFYEVQILPQQSPPNRVISYLSPLSGYSPSIDSIIAFTRSHLIEALFPPMRIAHLLFPFPPMHCLFHLSRLHLYESHLGDASPKCKTRNENDNEDVYVGVDSRGAVSLIVEQVLHFLGDKHLFLPWCAMITMWSITLKKTPWEVLPQKNENQPPMESSYLLKEFSNQ